MISLYNAFAALGCLMVVYYFTGILWELFNCLVGHVLPYLNINTIDLKEKYGSWAVVTGSTDGIGKAYAKALARRGINIVLISRTEEKLIKVASEIQKSYEVKTKIICADFSKGQPIYEKIEAELRGIEVGILVNNVGVMYECPTYLCDVEEQVLWNIINVNIGAAVSMTRMLLPQMLERKKGAIVNISSGTEMQPMPLAIGYASSKVFMRSFSESLRGEYGHQGITIQHVIPFFVNTKMNAFCDKLQVSNTFVPDADTYSESTLNTLGHLNTTTGYWAHGIQYFLTAIPPAWIRTTIAFYVSNVIRENYFEKTGKLSNKNY